MTIRLLLRCVTIHHICSVLFKACIKSLPSWWIWSQRWFRRFIFNKLISNLSARCCATSDLICILSSSMRQWFAAIERLFQVCSLCHYYFLSKVSRFSEASKFFIVDLVLWNWTKTSFWWWNSSRYFTMYSIMASVWYQYCAIRWNYSKFLTHNRASLQGIIGLTKGFERVATKTGTIMQRSASISLPLHYITWLYGMMNQASQDMETPLPRAGVICQSCNVFCRMTLPSPSDA